MINRKNKIKQWIIIKIFQWDKANKNDKHIIKECWYSSETTRTITRN
jgi:hypothetical protein